MKDDVKDEVQSKDLTLPNRDELVEAFKKKTVATIVERIKKEVSSIHYDVEDAKERKATRSLAAKVARSKTAIDDLGKKLTEDARAYIDEVNGERKIARDELDALKKSVLEPVDKWEAQDEARKAVLKDRLKMFGLDRADYQSPSDDVQSIIDELETVAIDESWEEFQSIAEEGQTEALDFYRKLLANVKIREDQEATIRALEEERAKEKAAEEERRKAEAERQAKELEEIRAKQVEMEREKAEREEAERTRQAERDAAKSFSDDMHAVLQAMNDGQTSANMTLTALQKMKPQLDATGDARQGLESSFAMVFDQVSQKAEAERKAEAEAEEEARKANERAAREAQTQDAAAKKEAHAKARAELVAKVLAQLAKKQGRTIANMIVDNQIDGVEISWA